jgi:peptide subunit release factor 1 (eRF1)
MLLGTTRLNPKTTSSADVMRAALEVRQTKEREWEAQHLEQLEAGLGTRWAVNGLDATVAALGRGQVRTLLVDPAAQATGYRCSDTGRLSVQSGGCKGEGAAEPVPDIIDAAIEDALHQGGHVDVIEGESSAIDKLAALLRFPQR